MSEAQGPLISIIIRTKNEERWINSCLRAVCAQAYKNFEIIIVDNMSTDCTLRRAKEFPVKVVQIDNFTPGKAINMGIRESVGEYLVCLSGHCIPVNDKWLGNLVTDLVNDDVAGVYGRQEPLSFSSDFDKRDLITVFGLDKKIQLKDSFFHNANSAFRRSVWDQYPFDEDVTNIEDRVWGQRVIADGMKIVYEPSASVYHWHGIHQDLNPDRARRVVSILESIGGLIPTKNHSKVDDLNVIAVIPVRGKSRKVGDQYLLEYTVEAALKSRCIREVIVATDDLETMSLAKRIGAKAPFLRPKMLSEDHIDLTEVLRFTLDEIEKLGSLPDLVFLLEESYPFRSPTTLDEMVIRLNEQGLDTVVAARRESRGVWLESKGETSVLGEGFMPRKLKQSSALIGLIGLGCVTHPAFVRQGQMLGGKTGLFEIDDPLSALEFGDGLGENLPVEKLLGIWREKYFKERSDDL